MGAWPTLYVGSYGTSPLVVAATAGKARRLAAEASGAMAQVIHVEEVPLADAVKVTRIPTGPLPGAVAVASPSPIDEPVAPARRGDPETATRAAAKAKALGPNRRTEILRWIVAFVRDGGADLDGRREAAWAGTSGAIATVGQMHGVTESELTREFGGVAGGNSKRLGELIEGSWLYARGTRPSVSTGTAQRVCFPTHGAIEWVRANPS